MGNSTNKCKIDEMALYLYNYAYWDHNFLEGINWPLYYFYELMRQQRAVKVKGRW